MNRLALIPLLLLAIPAFADGTDLLIADESPISVSIHHADTYHISLERSTDTGGLVVSGTYSSADRYGIEGLAVVDGELASDRLQSWDGIMTVVGGGVRIHHKARINLEEQILDITNEVDRDAVINYLDATRGSLIQSHLLIVDGEVDVRDSEGAPKFIRRIAYTNDEGQFGIYQSETPLTLYDATQELYGKGDVRFAFNLDMGAYDFCRSWNSWTLDECGDPTAGVEALTNFIEVIFVP